ncbi:hypothetical protein CHELA40_15151 [Chelatococcus asaccharovorans]|nr:hypothetical protein CHELA17_60469 [Chelatococcus asaccharovorans]CAH1681656.1 hypothetical protein CHELA40_15151 [Chelatococcus asaccharovorans]
MGASQVRVMTFNLDRLFDYFNLINYGYGEKWSKA